MYIGEVATKTGLSVKAIRFYEQQGLIKVARADGNYRLYNTTHIDLLLLIKQAREIGVPVKKLQTIIVYDHDQIDWQRIEEFLLLMKQEFQQQIQRLQQQIKQIDNCCDQMHQ